MRPFGQIIGGIIIDIDQARTLNALVAKCDSPIQVNFLRAFTQIANMWGFKVASEFDGPDSVIRVIPEHCIGPYRVDLLVSYHFRGSEMSLIVECDGHDFHEKTKEQAARDKRRLRALQKRGYVVLPFTGSEIYRNPEEMVMATLTPIMIFQTECFMAALREARKVAA